MRASLAEQCHHGQVSVRLASSAEWRGIARSTSFLLQPMFQYFSVGLSECLDNMVMKVVDIQGIMHRRNMSIKTW